MLKAVSCSLWFKDTNLKANHNIKKVMEINQKLFFMVQRY